MTEEIGKSDIEQLVSSLLQEPLGKNLSRIMGVVDFLGTVPNMDIWVLRISWSLRNGDSISLRENLLHVLKQLENTVK